MSDEQTLLELISDGDFSRAFKVAVELSDKGSMLAAEELARMYASGHGVSVAPELAIEHYKLAAERGSIESAEVLVSAYDGFVTDLVPSHERDNDLSHGFAQIAFKLRHQLAGEGDQSAMYMVASYHLIGFGTEQDSKEACNLFEILAHQGDPSSAYALASIHLSGQGVAVNKTIGRKWYNFALNLDPERSCPNWFPLR